jgi:hypothetical protein
MLDTGPPDDSMPVPLHLYVCLVPPADVLVSFLVVTYEQLVIVKEIISI